MEQILLGALQGVLEWLPISSEGIIALLGDLFTNQNPVDLALFLHLGTLLTVLVYFRKDWYEVFTFRNPKLVYFLLLSTPISLLAGFILYPFIRNVAVGSALLMIMGLGLLTTSYMQKSERKKLFGFVNMSLFTGLLQGLAVIPGMSRSGSTIFGLTTSNLSSKEILKYSYMMSVPAVLASNIYLWINQSITVSGWPALISSFIVGLIALHYLLEISKKISFHHFTLTFGILCLLGAFIGIT